MVISLPQGGVSPIIPTPEGGDLAAAMIRFSVLASRSGPRGETIMRWDWDHGTVTEMDPAQFRKEQPNGSGD